MDTTLGDPMVGRLIDGRYAVEAFIAHGGMAAVYLATDTRLERRVAVKMLHAHLADNPETLARFEREARAAARLSHPNVVAVYDQGIDHGRPFLVMEYVAGANLRHVLRERGKLELGEAVGVMDQVLAALAAAHAAGLIHRDVKPENVLLTPDGRVKVADFGLARAVSGTTVTTTGSVLFGTAAYLAPEQFEQGTADARSDVYSAGVVFFELLTGTTPFEGESAYAVLHRHANENVPAPGTRAAGVPPQVDALVTWATSRDPQQRPADAAELHAELAEVRDRLGLRTTVPALPTSLTTRFDAPAIATGTSDVTVAMPSGGNPSPPPPPVAAKPAKPPRPRRRKGPWIGALVGVVVIVLAAVLGWYFAEGRYTHTPNVLKLRQSAAVAKLKEAGLHMQLGRPIHSIGYAAGEVAHQSPAAGHRVTHGQTVTLEMSLGPIHHSLPSLQRDTVAQATQTLAKIHVSVSSQRPHYNTLIPKGDVIGTNPAAGHDIAEGSSVVLKVSRGPAPVTIPDDLVGATENDASAELSHLGLQVNPIQHYSSSVLAGDVIRVRPAPGRTAHKGDTVTLVFSEGPRPEPVPNVINESIDSAVRDIRQAGFSPKAVEVLPGGPDEVLEMKVNGQVIHPNQDEPRGTTIELDYF